MTKLSNAEAKELLARLDVAREQMRLRMAEQKAAMAILETALAEGAQIRENLRAIMAECRKKLSLNDDARG